MKEVKLKKNLYNSIYMTFGERQNYNHQKEIKSSQALNMSQEMNRKFLVVMKIIYILIVIAISQQDSNFVFYIKIL